jgi:carboxymethylenebutenolidase
VVEIASGLHRKNRRNRLLLWWQHRQYLAGSTGDLAAAAPFYGDAPKPEDVPKTTAAILIHHGALDEALSEAYPAQEAELKKNNIRHEGHIYPNLVHGFFNDATPERYNKVTAQQASTRTIDWFNQYVRDAQG